MSPTSTMKVAAQMSLTPRKACKRSTTGVSGQSSMLSSIAFSKRNTLSRHCVSATINSCRTACWPAYGKLSPCIHLKYFVPQAFKPGKILPCRNKKDRISCRLRVRSFTAASRARIRSRIASCAASGVQISVSSRARNNRASFSASRRFVLIRSPGLRGIKDGAMTAHSWPSASISRFSPYPVGPAS